MKPRRINMYTKYIVSKITNRGFDIKTDDTDVTPNIEMLVNSPRYTDSAYRCVCGQFQGQDVVGQICPLCHEEIMLRSLDFRLMGFIDLGNHYIITQSYFSVVRRVLGNNMLKFILGDYINDEAPRYVDDEQFYEAKQSKRAGRVSDKDIAVIRKKIPKSKQIYEGLGHDEFRNRFEEVIRACAQTGREEEVEMLIANQHDVWTNKIPIYSNAFRPVSKTSETMYYPKINKWFTKMVAVAITLNQMVLDVEVIRALNHIQNDYNEAIEYLLKNEVSSKQGFVRKEIVGGTFNFSARGVIILDISLDVDEVDLPYSMCLTAYQYKIAQKYAVRYNTSLEFALTRITTCTADPKVVEILDEIIAEEQWIFILREPAINLASIALCKIRNYKMNDDTISLPPEPLGGYNADFDGDQLDLVFLPKEIVPEFEAFHYSCMSDYVRDEIKLDMKEWMDIAIARMSE